ncbi:MAG: methylated-DNA--[protein]-cysteine S-methyltransferase [Alphaproteobacteria bacterium]
MEAIQAIVASPLGHLRLTVTGGALTHLDWTDDQLTGHPNDPVLIATADQLDTFFRDPKTVFDLPLSAAGNAFEHAVWNCMLEIPSSETMTYGDIAKQTQRPAQAVGGACGRNPIPIIIPCHRVVGADGRMTGYSGRGGVDTKQWLLRHEGVLLL